MDPEKSAGEGSSFFAAEDSGNIFDWIPSLLPLQSLRTELFSCSGRPLLHGRICHVPHRLPRRRFPGKGI
jgi:hypothetical protein